jgi:hypothetical protein
MGNYINMAPDDYRGGGPAVDFGARTHAGEAVAAAQKNSGFLAREALVPLASQATGLCFLLD